MRGLFGLGTSAEEGLTEYEQALRAEPMPRGGSMFGFSEEGHKHRRRMVTRFSWAIPNLEALLSIGRVGPIIEVGAGQGYWAYELAKLEYGIVATDIAPERGGTSVAEAGKQWFPVQKMSAAAAVKKYAKTHTLLTVWPAYNEDWTSKMLKAYHAAGGAFVAYVGEGQGGCTADVDFHDFLEDAFFLFDEVDIPTYHDIGDRLTIWQRK
jgi:hypothetical protein